MVNTAKVKVSIKMQVVMVDYHYLFSLFSISAGIGFMTHLTDLTSPNIDRPYMTFLKTIMLQKAWGWGGIHQFSLLG